MERKEFLDVKSLEAAKKIVDSIDVSISGEEVDISNAVGRVVFEEVISPIDVPSFDRASMDGYAVLAEDTFYADEQNPVKLKLKGEIRAGEKSELSVKRGSCVGIATGAPVPYGSNAVVMVEYTNQEGDEIEIFRSLAPGENIMAAGADIMRGETIMRRGTKLTPRETGVLAASGIKHVFVYKRPKVAIISTGDEIIEPGMELKFGKIYDVNSRAISDSVIEVGGESTYLGIVKDDFLALDQKIKEILSMDFDIILTSGGTSAGVGDILYKIIDNLGQTLVHGVAIKPGKPVLIGVCKDKPIFGLPGYPTSALVVFNTFVAPLIKKMCGLTHMDGVSKRILGKTAMKLFSAKGRYEYLPVNIVALEDCYSVYPVLFGSGAITTLSTADGFVNVPENIDIVGEGQTVEVELISETLKPADLCVIGSHCIGLDLIIKILNDEYGIITKILNVGSTGGLAAVRRGEADISGMHLLDEKKGEYNTPYLKNKNIDALLFRGYERRQGLIVKRGNPKKIKSIKSLTKKGVRFINRNNGSGTRILFDMELKKLSLEKKIKFEEIIKEIQGYHLEAKSHNAISAAIAYDRADCGMGIEVVSDMYNLDFIPIREEKFDFAIPERKIDKREIQLFLEVLRSKKFKNQLDKMVGLKTSDETGKRLI